MKKVKVLLLVSVFTYLGIQQVKAQSALESFKKKLTLGVKLDGGGNNFMIKDNAALKSNTGAGGAIGTFIRFNISDHFAIQEDIMFVYNTYDLEKNGVADKLQYFGSEVPIYLMGQWKTKSGGRIFAGAGPYFGIGFIGKYKNDDIDVFKKYDDEKSEMKRLSNGFAANFGYELKSGLQINATYKYGFNTLNRDKDIYKMLPQSFSIGLGYSF